MALPVIVDIQVAQHRESSIVIGWRSAVPSVIPPGTQVKVYRSYHQVDGFTEIDDVPMDQGLYIDEYHDDRSKNIHVFYRLRVYNTSDPTTYREYGPVHLQDGPDRIGRMIIRRMNQMLRLIGATPVLIYQEAYGSPDERDEENWDDITGQVIDSVSTNSGFTGTVMGYYNPILTLMDIRPADKLATIEDTAQQPRHATARMGNFPVLRTNDVIREVNTGTLWKVTSITPVRKDQRALLTQDPVSLRQIKHGDFEWDLPVPDTLVPILRRRRVKRERILQDNKDGTPRFLDVWI